MIVDVRVECAPEDAQGDGVVRYALLVTGRTGDPKRPRESWTVLRRYSEFEAVDAHIRAILGNGTLAALPGKAVLHTAWRGAAALIGRGRGEDADFVRRRAAGLDRWAKDVRQALSEAEGCDYWRDGVVSSFFGIPESVLAGADSPQIRLAAGNRTATREPRILRAFLNAAQLAEYVDTDAQRAVQGAERTMAALHAALSRGGRPDAYVRAHVRAVAAAADALWTAARGAERLAGDAQMPDIVARYSVLCERLEAVKLLPFDSGATPDTAAESSRRIPDLPKTGDESRQRIQAPNWSAENGRDSTPQPQGAPPSSTAVQEQIDAQDRRLDELFGAARRQRDVSGAINAEVLGQNDALEALRAETARVEQKYAAAQRDISRV